MEAPPQAASPQPDPRCKVPFRLQSIVVAPSVKSRERQLAGSCSDTRSWKKVKSRSSQHHASSTSSRLPRRSQLSSSTAFLNHMHGRCFRCLARDHKVAVCRDPPKCFYCSRSGHLYKTCPARRKLQARRPAMERLRSNFVDRRPVHERLHFLDEFPPLAAPTMLRQPIHERLGPASL
ncbi:hypothetical protein C2845_PM02G43310 [Panicum miliaceum]|uniref:CCHC-type domain-containing protein n=1 Tax=Panicum miliaceum TaxID=4540 RepID=A0A3L6SFG7_PANMI|nr:hypothetical protein C2845_PM02G43310 [Panicum miliaceum]